MFNRLMVLSICIGMLCSNANAAVQNPHIIALSQANSRLDLRGELGVPLQTIQPCGLADTQLQTETFLSQAVYWREHFLNGESFLWAVKSNGGNNCAMLFSPEHAALNADDYAALERISRAIGAFPVAQESTKDDPVAVVNSGTAGTIGQLYNVDCPQVVNAQPIGSAIYVKPNLAFTAGVLVNGNANFCLVTGGELHHIKLASTPDGGSAPALSIGYLDLWSNKSGPAFAVESTTLPNTQAAGTIQNSNGTVTGLASVSVGGPGQFISVNAPNVVNSFLFDRGGVLLYPIGTEFSQPTSVKGLYVSGASGVPYGLLSRVFSSQDAQRVAAHPSLQNALVIASPSADATLYSNSAPINLQANQSVSWLVNGLAYSGNTLPVGSLNPGRNVVTAIGANSRLSVIVNRSLTAPTEFLGNNSAAIVVPVGQQTIQRQLEFYSDSPGLTQVKLMATDAVSNIETQVPFTIFSTGSFGVINGRASVNIAVGANTFSIRRITGNELLAQITLQGTTTADTFETDNTPETASFIGENQTQSRSFGPGGDEDWIQVDFSLGDNLNFYGTEVFELWGYSPDVQGFRWVPNPQPCGMFKISELSNEKNLQIRQPLNYNFGGGDYCKSNFSKLYMKFSGVKKNYYVQYFKSNTATTLYGVPLTIFVGNTGQPAPEQYFVTVYANDENYQFLFPYDMHWIIKKNGVEVYNERVLYFSDFQFGLNRTGPGVYEGELRICYFNGACVTTRSQSISLP